MNTNSRARNLCLILIGLAWVATAALYSRLPEQVPTHWNAKGHADGFSPKPWGPFLLPLLLLGIFALFRALPRISPRGFEIERFRSVYELFALAIIAFLFFLNVLALLSGIGVAFPMERAVFAGTGLLLAILGNFFGKLRRSLFVGIRTPWTLASDEVWLRTHRLGGKLFVIAGIGLFVCALLGWGGAALLLVAVALAGGVPCVYSYLLYRRLEGGKGGP